MGHDPEGPRGPYACTPGTDPGRGGRAYGAGRAKAKQTKVDRQLKYGGPQTDLTALEAELSGREDVVHEVEETDEDDPYAKYYDDDEE